MNVSRQGATFPGAAAFVLALAVFIAAVSGACAAPGAAAAESFGVGAFSSQMSETQAGGHPDLTTSITLNNEALGNPIQQLKDVEVELPPGLGGNPQAIPQCSSRQLETLKCPPDSQIGVIEPLFVIACRGVTTTLGTGGFISASPTTLTEAVSAGATTLPVESTTGIEPGDILTVGSGSGAREATVSSVLDATHLRLTFSIEAPFPAGTVVADDVISVADTTGFCAGSETGEVTIGSGANAEVAHLRYVLSPTRLALEAPLEKPHSTGEPVTHIAEVKTGPFPLYNLEPGRGHLATLGASFLLGSIIVQLDQREDESGGIDASISDLTTLFGLDGARFTLWGVPAAASHDSQRCTLLGHECSAATVEPRPFISAPAQCSQALTTNLRIDSWQEPGRFETASSSQAPPTGCDRLRFSPTLMVTPDTTAPDSPAGYTVDLRLPREPEPLAPEGPALESVVVSLPPGVSLSPPGAAGLRSCGQGRFAAGVCPAASAVGDASLLSPALAAPLEGKIYAATPRPGIPYGLYLIASDEALSVDLEGQLELDPASGRVTVAFHGLPPLPLSEMRVSFVGGPGAPLANPAGCGEATTTARLLSSAGQVAVPSSSFVVSSGRPGACAAPRAFAPRFSAGMTDSRAGATGAFELDLGREDGEGDLGAIRLTLPPGLLARFSAISPCPTADADQGSCPGAAAIGSTDVVVGAGGEPLDLPGTVYLTGPYDGAPFGLAIVVPAAAGPFELGTIVVRARVMVNPRSLRITIATDPLPEVVGGVVTRIRAIHLRLDRQGFLVNPTNCSPASVAATVWSAEGEVASPGTLFVVHGCDKLGFTPRLRASAHGGVSRGGAGLALEIRAGPDPQVSLQSLALRLPRQLHPRLGAIQRACVEAVYRSAPSACPQAARIGHVAIASPLLQTKLEGSAYLVDRGGGKVPILAAPLNSGGISLTLEGRIDLNGKGATTISLTRLPDVPLRAIRLVLPRSPNAALGVARPLCDGPRPNVGYRAEGQDGARLARTVAVAVQGCGDAAQGRRAVPRR
jgi:hypothetical protein